MLARLFCILNLCWAALMAAVMSMLHVLAMPDAPLELKAGVVFWYAYVLVALGVCANHRVAWVLCILQLVTVWLVLGLSVSEQSFLFLAGQAIDLSKPSTIMLVAFNSFFGVLVPASGLMIILVLCREEVVWILRGNAKRRRRPRNGRQIRCT